MSRQVGEVRRIGSLETLILMKFESLATYGRWDDQDKLVHLMAAIEGNAAQLLHSCKGMLTFANLVDKLRQRYGSEDQLDRYRHELLNRKQRPTESLQELANDIKTPVGVGVSYVTT